MNKSKYYRLAVEWVALNDENGADFAYSVDAVSNMISVCLIADVFKVDRQQVALAVVKFRRDMQEDEVSK